MARARIGLLGLWLALWTPLCLQAAIETRSLDYRQGEVRLVGYLAVPKDTVGPRPGVVVVHEWMGLNDYAKRRADQLAELGYVALAADIYGGGKIAADAKQASEWAGVYKKDRALLRARVGAALETLKAQPHVNPNQLAAIGYCFGGTTVLELARSGAHLAGVVSFHGGLDTPTPQDAQQSRAKVLVLHGADDPYVPPEHVMAFEQEMRAGGVDWQLISYGGAVHGFTNPSNGSDNSKGVAYNAVADTRSWAAMQQFFAELFTQR